MNEIIVTNSEAMKRYETTVNGHVAYLEYMPAGQSIVLSHTEVPVELEGQGVGSQLAKYVLDLLKDANQKAIITCPFVIGYIKRHQEYLTVVFGYPSK